MKKIVLMFIAVIILWPALSFARKTTYIATDHRFDYVKLREVKAGVAEERNMTHPKQLDEQGLREALKSVELSKSYITKKEVDTQRVFDNSAIDFLVVNFAKAFSRASSNEEVVFSYLQKNPLFILRNDRINLGQAWLSGDELHIKFEKLYAKVTGDVDKRGNEAKAIARARGLRVRLELGPGQTMGVKDTSELILNLHYNYAEEVKPTEVPTTTKTMAGETVAVPGAEEVNKAEVASNSTPTSPTVTTETNTETNTVKERLQALEELKKEGVISNKEYNEKRKEILKDL
ncbi:MAG: hypothetical protein ABH871_00055 [Pseudomonadota bacterium]